MKRIILISIIILLLVMPVHAMEFTAPEAPDSVIEYMPDHQSSFGADLWHVIKVAVEAAMPSVAEASGVCLSLISVVILVSLLDSFSESSKRVTETVGALAIGILLIQPSSALVQLGVNTVTELSEYGKLLLPVMTAALAAQGGSATSAALYVGTAVFDSMLTTVISKLIVPMIYVFLCLCIADSAICDQALKGLKDFMKWLITWSMKTLLYIFTGYMTVTGVVSGTADASALKAAKMTISSAVPVVGNILSDASEAILVGAGVMKSAAGTYGLISVIAIFIGPFLKVGIQYLLLKLTAAVCGVLGAKKCVKLVQDFSTAMGFILAMTGTTCLLILISTVCFMKGIS